MGFDGPDGPDVVLNITVLFWVWVGVDDREFA